MSVNNEKISEIKKQQGYIAAYGVVKAQKHDPKSLHMATVEMGGGLGGKAASTIYTYFWGK